MKLAERLTLARELRRILRLIWGESWAEVYADLAWEAHMTLPTLEELEYADTYGCDEDQLEADIGDDR